MPYERCVSASTGRRPSRPKPRAKRERVAELLATPGIRRAAATAARRRRRVARASGWSRGKSIQALGDAFIAQFDALTASATCCRICPTELARVPRANITFLPIENAWFSGSMNYLGRARNADGTPEYEATYEINASLEISVPEFQQLVSHEVVPGHVTTFAYLQNLFVRGQRRLRGDGADDEHARAPRSSRGSPTTRS